jgi:hypothetical protein
MGHLHDELLNHVTDMELVTECLNFYIVQHSKNEDVVFHALHSDDEKVFKTEWKRKILEYTDNQQHEHICIKTLIDSLTPSLFP